MVTLSATGGPATAALPPASHPLQPGPLSQPPVDAFRAAVLSETVSAAGVGHPQSSTIGHASQRPVDLAESQGKSTSNTATSEQSHSTDWSARRDRDDQSEQPLHSALAGMSLSGDGPQSQPTHASEPDETGVQQHSQHTETTFNDPLRRGQRPDTQQGSQQGKQHPHVTAAQSAIDLPLFTGFVSHEQLETAIGSTSYERRLASSKELTHWVKMRGPGVL